MIENLFIIKLKKYYLRYSDHMFLCQNVDYFLVEYTHFQQFSEMLFKN
jgi:hypothetical protein